MKPNDCSIVQDLLPLYIEDMLRPDTTAFVEDHLSGCPVCTAALGDLKTETAAPIPTPDAAEARQADQQVLKGLRKNLSLQHVAVVLAFVDLIMHFFPWFSTSVGPGIANLVFTGFPIYMAASMACRRDELSRNMALLATGLTLPTACYPLYLFVIYGARIVDSFLAGEPPRTVFHPSFLLSLLCGLLLTGIALHNIWCKLVAPPTHRDPRKTAFSISAFVVTGCIVLLSFFPIIPPDKNYSHILPLFNLFYGGLPLCLTFASAFCQVKRKKEAVGATLLALLFPAYTAYPFFVQYSPLWSGRYIWTEYNASRACHVPFLFLSCLLAAIAICRIWYQLIHQTKAQQKCRLEESHETK